MTVDPSGARRGVRQVEGSLDRVANRADRLRRLMTRAFAAIGAGIGGATIVRRIAEFGQAMSTVRAITGATEQTFESLRRRARDLGATTRFTATQAAEGMLFLARAGFDTDEVLASIAGTLNLAQAGALDLGRAADIASNILTGFRLEADQTARVVDVMALAANSSNTNIEQLGDAMKFVAPVAAGLGVSIEDATAAIGALSDAGLQGSLAGTGLRRVLSELESPATKTVDILKSLGLTTDDVRVSQVGLITALQRLREAGVDTGQALEIFGDRGGPAFEVLASSIPRVRELARELDDAGGTAAEVSRIMDDNLNGALLRVASAFESVILAFGELGAESVLTQAFNGLAIALRYVGDNLAQVGRYALALGLALAAPVIGRWVRGLGAATAATTGLRRAMLATVAAARLLGRVFLFGLLVEGINLAIERYDHFLRFIRETPATWGDVAALSVDFFVNRLIQGLLQAANVVQNGLRLITDPIAYAFAELGGIIDEALSLQLDPSTIGRRLGDALQRGFADAFARLSETDRLILDTRFVEIATDEQIRLYEYWSNAISEEAYLTAEAVRLPGEAAADTTEAVTNQAREQAEEFEKLRDRLDPLGAGTRQLIRDYAALARAQRAGNITTAEAVALNERLTDEFDRQFNPLRGLTDELKRAGEISETVVGQREQEARVLDVIARAKQQGIDLTREETDELRRLVGELDRQNDALQRERRAYEAVRDPLEDYRLDLEALQRVVAQYPEHSARAERATEALRLKFLETQTDLASGFERGLLKASASFMDFASVADRAVTGWAQRAEDVLVEFVTTGRASFKDLTDAIIQDLARISIRKFITEPILSELTDLIGGIRGAGSGIGGIIGSLLGGGGGGGVFGGILRGITGGIGGIIRGVGSLFGFASGGLVGRVSNGEYLVPPGAAQRNAGLLQAINSGLPRFQEGGFLFNLSNLSGGARSILGSILGGLAVENVGQVAPEALTAQRSEVVELLRMLVAQQAEQTAAIRETGDPEGAREALAEQRAFNERFEASFDILSRPDFRADRAIGGATARIGPGGNLTSDPASAFERGVFHAATNFIGSFIPFGGPIMAALTERSRLATFQGITDDRARSGISTGLEAAVSAITGAFGRVGDFLDGLFSGDATPVSQSVAEIVDIAVDEFGALSRAAETLAETEAGVADVGREVAIAHEDVAVQAHLAAAGIAGIPSPAERMAAAMDRTTTQIERQIQELDAHTNAIVDATESTRNALATQDAIANANAQTARAALAAADATADAARSAREAAERADAYASRSGGDFSPGDAEFGVGVGDRGRGFGGFGPEGGEFGFAAGGLIRGPGSGTSDSIVRALPLGGFVVNARATRRHRRLLDAISGYAAGGYITGRVSAGEYLVEPDVAGRHFDLLAGINGGAYQTGGEVRAGPTINVQIVNAPAGSTPSVDFDPDDDGGGTLLIDMQAEAIERGDLDGPLERRFGLRPTLI